MKKLFQFGRLLLVFFCVFSIFVAPSLATDQEFTRGVITSFEQNSDESFDVEAKISEGKLDGREVRAVYGGDFFVSDSQKFAVGDEVVLTQLASGEWQIYENYRLPGLFWIAAIFLVLVVLIAKKRGVTAIVGLLASVGIVVFGIFPAIVDGVDPLVATFFGSIGIAVVSLFLAHGFSKRSSLALAATLATLLVAIAMAVGATDFAQIFGTGAEESFYLVSGLLEGVDLRGIFLAGVIIGTLGVLDDITVSQVCAIAEIHEADPTLSRRELFRRGMIVGREHIASMVNTLALAYVGCSLPLLLLLSIDQSMPWWVVVNSEQISEEIVRTLVGSAALVLAAPIASLLAAHFFSPKKS